MVSVPNEGFGTYISQLSLGRDMGETDETFQEFLSHKVTVNFNVLRSFMEHRVASNVYSCKVVTLDWNWSD